MENRGEGARIPFAYPMEQNNSSYGSGRAPYFNGTHYGQWKHKMKMHLKSINSSVWNIVENGYTVADPAKPTPQDDVNEHLNAQATNAIFGALSGDEFNRIATLESANEIWTTLKNVHEGTSSVRESKIELLKGKLDRFVMNENETPSEMYNRLNLLVNEIKGLGNKEMTDSFIVKRMLRAITPRNVTLVTLIRERDDFDTLTPHDVLGRILAHDLMQQESKEVYDLTNQGSSSKKQNLALKAKQEEEESTSGEECGELQDEEMALFVRRFNKFFKKGVFNKSSYSKKPFNKSRPRYSERRCYECGETGHFIAKCPNKKDKDEGGKKESKKEKYYKRDKTKRYKKNYKGQAHLGEEWDSNSSGTDSDEDEGVATIALATSPPKMSLFDESSDEETPKCLMAKGAKVTPPTKTLNVDLNSDDENDMLEELNELSLPSMSILLDRIEIQEETLEEQEDLLIFEKERNLELESALAKEKEKNEVLSKMLKLSKSSITKLENEKKSIQDDFECLDKSFKALKVMFEKQKDNDSTINANDALNAQSSSSIENCIKCKNIDVNAIATNAKAIQVLTSQNEKLKSLIHNGLLKCHKGSKTLNEVLGAQKESFNREGLGYIPAKNDKGKTWVQKDKSSTKFVNAKSNQRFDHFSHGNFDTSYVLTKNRLGVVIAMYVGNNIRNAKRSIWVPKVLVTNMKGPKQIWVPKNKT